MFVTATVESRADILWYERSHDSTSCIRRYTLEDPLVQCNRHTKGAFTCSCATRNQYEFRFFSRRRWMKHKRSSLDSSHIVTRKGLSREWFRSFQYHNGKKRSHYCTKKWFLRRWSKWKKHHYAVEVHDIQSGMQSKSLPVGYTFTLFSVIRFENFKFEKSAQRQWVGYNLI